jgi:hypothetical protein
MTERAEPAEARDVLNAIKHLCATVEANADKLDGPMSSAESLRESVRISRQHLANPRITPAATKRADPADARDELLAKMTHALDGAIRWDDDMPTDLIDDTYLDIAERCLSAIRDAGWRITPAATGAGLSDAEREALDEIVDAYEQDHAGAELTSQAVSKHLGTLEALLARSGAGLDG